MRVWVFLLLVFYANCVIAPAESKRGYVDLMSLLLRDDENDNDDVAEDHRELAEMESPAQLHGCKDKLDHFEIEDGRFGMFKLVDETRSGRPVNYIITQEVFVYLLSESISKSCSPRTPTSGPSCASQPIRKWSRKWCSATMTCFGSRYRKILKTAMWRSSCARFW